MKREFRIDSHINFSLLNAETANSLIQILTDNPYGRFERLRDHNVEPDYQILDFDKGKLSTYLLSEASANLTLLHGPAGAESVAFDLIQRKKGTTLLMQIKQKKVSSEYPRFLKYFRKVVQLLPGVTNAYAYDGDADFSKFYQKYKIENPPVCFKMHLRWYHILGPDYYKLFLDRVDLLNTPEAEVEEWENGLISLQMYQDPFQWHQSDNIEKIIRITTYLNAKDHFMKNIS